MRRILYFTPTLHPLAVCMPMMPQGPKHTSKFDVKLVFGLEDLDVEGTVGGKVLHSPGSKNGLVILGEVWLVMEGLPLRVGRQCRLGGSVSELTAAVRSTSFLLLRIKQASPLSILQSTSC